MQINALTIRNTKSLDFLELSLAKSANRPNQRVHVLLAANGQGKTTTLEALSLVGHLTCMSVSVHRRGQKTAWTPKDVGPSALWQLPTDKRRANPGLELTSELQTGLLHIHQSLETMSLKETLSTKNPNWPLALSGFHFDVRFEHQSENRSLEFLIVCPAEKSLSTILSSEFTNCIQFQNYATVIVLHESKSDLNSLIQQLVSGRSFDISLSGKPNHIRPKASPNAPFVSYVNTDLSDFGRGNDLRESPKSLQDQFVEQMIERIGIPLAADGQFLYFADLKQAVSDALRAPVQEVRNDFLIPQQFKLMQLSVSNHRLNIEVQRGSKKISNGITHISAGENEVLFVYLMTLSFKGRPGIILLDEPDLHLATLTKRNFFDVLFRIADLTHHQIVIATHSDSIFYTLNRLGWSLSEVIRLIYTYAEDPNEPLTSHRTVAEYDPHFVSALLRNRRRYSIGRALRLRISLIIDNLKAKRRSWKSMISEISIILGVLGGVPALTVPFVSYYFDSQLKSQLTALDVQCKVNIPKINCEEKREHILRQHEDLTRKLPSSGVAFFSSAATALAIGFVALAVRRYRRKSFQRKFEAAIEAAN